MTPYFVSAENQGLSWGVPVGERREFNFFHERSSTVFSYIYYNERVTLEVTENPQIPDNITAIESSGESVDIPQIERVGYWENGTEMGQYVWRFPLPVLLPVGNWTLIASLFSDLMSFYASDYTTEVINGHQRIGYRYTASITDWSLLVEVWWSKADGMLLHYLRDEHEARIEGIETDSIIRINAVQDSLPWTAIMITAGAGGVLLLVGAAVLLKRRS